ncbi:MAG: TVP38/TMEM64 family protein [Candidatus Competibacteraceae bacterium]|nr:TVP38/TMEM64 family protein [Candidatus Competibacteraceae bacterium]
MITPEVAFSFIDAQPELSILIFIAVYAAAVVALLPTLPFNLAAGVIWGPIAGGVVATLGTTLGAACAFSAARLLFGQPLAARFDNRLICRLQDEYSRLGWRFIAFIRINPAFPTGPLNYILGFTSVGFLTFGWATFLFLLPPSMIVAWIGAEVGAFVADGNVTERITALIAISAGAGLLVALGYLARLFATKEKLQ